jgi:hypothetical protein
METIDDAMLFEELRAQFDPKLFLGDGALSAMTDYHPSSTPPDTAFEDLAKEIDALKVWSFDTTTYTWYIGKEPQKGKDGDEDDV